MRIGRTLLFSLLLMMAVGCGRTSGLTTTVAQVGMSDLLVGDLLFVAVGEENAITAVTEGYALQAIDHVGIVAAVAKGKTPVVTVVEAVPGRGVVRTTLSSFAPRDRIFVGRLRQPFSNAYLLARLRQFEGLPYDSLYLPDDTAIYCSELVQKCLADNRGRQILPTVPMTFRDAEGHIPDVFVSRYQAAGMEVPEGLLGTNPGQLSRDSAVCILGLLNRK